MDPLEIGYVYRGKNRVQILEALEDKPKANTHLSKELKISISNTRKVLNWLLEQEYISCKNPEDYHYKLYQITSKGKKILQEVRKLNNS